MTARCKGLEKLFFIVISPPSCGERKAFGNFKNKFSGVFGPFWKFRYFGETATWRKIHFNILLIITVIFHLSNINFYPVEVVWDLFEKWRKSCASVSKPLHMSAPLLVLLSFLTMINIIYLLCIYQQLLVLTSHLVRLSAAQYFKLKYFPHSSSPSCRSKRHGGDIYLEMCRCLYLLSGRMIIDQTMINIIYYI